ncbi:hypothetical protein [Streptomyces sp. NPDC006307]|uniref:hypothetical protein n=1 Tax=Streptomyces sp. NPDC006307 TaxID=3156748 RepID=UPI0033BB4125
MHRYRCPLCGITSAPYVTRAGADRHGAGHRDARHGGDHPDGEHIIRAAAHRAPQGSEWMAVLVVLVVLAIGLVGKIA